MEHYTDQEDEEEIREEPEPLRLSADKKKA